MAKIRRQRLGAILPIDHSIAAVLIPASLGLPGIGLNRQHRAVVRGLQRRAGTPAAWLGRPGGTTAHPGSIDASKGTSVGAEHERCRTIKPTTHEAYEANSFD